MTDSDDYRVRVIENGRRAGKSTRISEARAQFEAEQEVLGVLTGQVPVRSMPIAGKHHPRCNDLCRGESHHLCNPECEGSQ